ncbi:hypothetical protein A1D50_14460 [Salmonella enterica]|uniref:Uncharacterized protein n=2 Tax=Salmonella enterica TaxID=28901 RepID=A0A5U2NNP3_SALER|nr:hypothetical protein [Salmonella enterica subsp. enterica serovar Carmel]EAQ3438997.1 hypothetical protein [Salmonella enterica]EBV4372993.1 hypothetical protein [Salmonella enterica subsp. enterica serovar Matadi]EBW5060905.1 hypothetical protein [Salmonella enterica subsp. enterica serovar Somone]EBZ9042884.1 hypothetical protein [Salmonella enterica subsp. enterica serovar Uzaramo]ECA4032521.1 hypothetical protein [Salmonella enterica subsp. enterica serovar Odozi]EDW2185633.1 hypotheti
MGAVYDSIGQGGDYASAAGAERKNCFCVKKVFCEPALPRFACLLPIFHLHMRTEDRKCRFCFSGVCSRAYTYCLPSVEPERAINTLSGKHFPKL